MEKPQFRHQEVQTGEIRNFREDFNVFIVEVKDREVYREEKVLWLRFKLLVLDVLSGQEGWKGQELIVREASHAGHGLGMWTLRKITAPGADSGTATSFKPESCLSLSEWEDVIGSL